MAIVMECWKDSTVRMSESSILDEMVNPFPNEDTHWMEQALELARRGFGEVEPNPMVGCVLVREGKKIGEGWHRRFGESHAEVNALQSVRGDARGATAYVTLEPCSHQGKTPPCSRALIEAGVAKVVVAQRDPFEKVSGRGIQQLQDAGIVVEVGMLAAEARQLNAAYLKRLQMGLPWMIGKYAMTLDGKIATSSGDSKWISNASSREIVHRIRGNVDGILVGANTAQNDDPLLTARPAGARVPRRLVLDSKLRIDVGSQLVKTANEVPLDVCCGPQAKPQDVEKLQKLGVQVLQYGDTDPTTRMMKFLKHQVAEFDATNVLVEGGGQVMGSLRDCGQLDELHLFIGARVIGGVDSLSPVTGRGVETVELGTEFQVTSTQIVDGDVYLHALRKQSESK